MRNILGVILAPSEGEEDKQARFGIKSAESDNTEFLATSYLVQGTCPVCMGIWEAH